MKFSTFIDTLYPLMAASDGAGGGNPDDIENPEDDEIEEDEPEEEEEEKEDEKGKKSKSKKDTKKYSDKDLDEILEKKFAKWKSAEEKKLAEAKKLAGMSAAEKTQHKMEEALKRAEEAEAKLSHLSMTREARTILQEKNITLSDDLLELLVGEDAETTKTNIDDFTELFEKAVEAEVKKRLKGKTPKQTGGKATMTKDEIFKIKDPVARRKAIRENMALFED